MPETLVFSVMWDSLEKKSKVASKMFSTYKKFSWHLVHFYRWHFAQLLEFSIEENKNAEFKMETIKIGKKVCSNFLSIIVFSYIILVGKFKLSAQHLVFFV